MAEEQTREEVMASLVAATNHRAAFINQVEHAKQQFEARLQFAWEGHYFTLDYAFMIYAGMTFVEWNMAKQKRVPPPVILLDNSQEPVLIEDFEEFMDAINEAEQEALNDYYDQYSRLKGAKTTEQLYEVA
jgi:hypothetical protein